MLINIYEILDAALVGGVVGIFIIVLSFILKFIKKIKNSGNEKSSHKNINETIVNENQIVETKNATNKKSIKFKKSKLSDFANNLTKLGELRDKGLITEEEFLDLKRKIL